MGDTFACDRCGSVVATSRMKEVMFERDHERVTERHPRADSEQPANLHVIGGLQPDADSFGGAPEQDRITDWLRRCEQQQASPVI